MNRNKKRLSGILVHPTSFPSPYGIGDFGKGAYEFINFLEASGQHLWQVLPLGPTSFGDSPYQSFSAYAGQPLLISPENLIELDLITDENLIDMPKWNPRSIDYGEILNFKTQLFLAAHKTFCHTPNKMLLEKYDAFCIQNGAWLDDYALFMAAKDAHDGKCWLEWAEDLLNLTPSSRAKWEKKLEEEINYHKFLQFLFFYQWNALKEYANLRNIEIIGDIPIFVALDSADVWANKELFQLDSKGHPICVAGVPPDYFSGTGQLWGNPLYDWAAHKKENYQWWISRIRHQIQLTDHLRIDHFRGFEACWTVPASEETAIDGQWVTGPREDLFLAIQRALGDDLPIIAEDLGIITPEVERLREMFHFPGMQVLQFGFQDIGESTYLPHNFTTTNCVCYTGTHDNNTTIGWYQNISDAAKDKIRRYGNTDGSNISLDFIRFCLGSIAKYAIFPIQDILQLGSEDRMNTPGTSTENWKFRYLSEQLSSERVNWLRETTELFGR